MKQTVLFLDFDDVIALNKNVGAFDVLEALQKIQRGESAYSDFSSLWGQLFDKHAVANLQAIHVKYRPRFVLSTSWTRFMDKESLVAILHQTGLRWIADNLHQDWQTVENPSGQLRASEIQRWLDRHPESQNCWLILDDEYSGVGLDEWPVKEDHRFITLCQKQVGLMQDEAEQLREAFERRCTA